MNTKSHKLTARLLAVLLTVCTLVSMFVVFPFRLHAQGTVSKAKPADYLNQAYESAEAKWEMMGSDYTVRSGNYELRIDPVSAEVAVKNALTGEIQFSNPYNLSAVPSTVRAELLSQVALSYQKPGSNAVTTLYSYATAVREGQISIKPQKNGFSVSYTMGNISRRYLVPMMIEASRFQELILDQITDPSDKAIIESYYELVNLNDGSYFEKDIEYYIEKYPFLKERPSADNEYYASYENPYYAFYLPTDKEFSARQMREIQAIIRTYCSDYTFEELDNDHELTQYEPDDSKTTPLFKLTLEYALDEKGLRVSLPANSIRFDETEYTLHSVKVLPFFGAGDNTYEGYSFVPDGSGALLDFQESKGQSVTLGGNEFGMIYGADGAYYSANVRSTEEFRLPVFGLVEQHADSADRGFFAIVEEGEAMASITAQADTRHPFQTVYATFYPRPSDKTVLQNAAMSENANAEYTLVSDRKYSGDCTVRYFVLNDAQKAIAAGYEGYACSYVGMAKLYRDYLEETGVLSRLTAEEVKNTLPLYIESFGAMDVQDSFLSIPITKKLELTTFEDVQTMYEELKAKGITNINFRLTGFANGGMFASAPTDIEFESVVGGNEGYEALVAYAKEHGFGVYANFDFVQTAEDASFDGFSYSDDALKTIDNRYMRAKKYHPVYQTYAYTGNILISPEAYLRLYSRFVGSMLEMEDHIGISVGTLGSNLNSDFDEDDSYNRVETQELTKTMLNRLQTVFKDLMVDGGNAYALPYANHILNVSLDSSHYQQASRTIPFVGMVLHGYVNFAGTATNMAAEPAYETLKMIENGAAPYYILSYRNTNKLKDDEDLSDYYAVAYEYGKEDMMEKYLEMNGILGNLQTVRISDHAFLTASRIRTEADIAYDTAIGLTDEQIAEKYLIDDGTVVKVTYENGTFFYLNYNYADVVVDGITLPAMSYIKGVN